MIFPFERDYQSDAHLRWLASESESKSHGSSKNLNSLHVVEVHSMNETLAYYGGAVKALGAGRIAGYGILFTNEPDLQGDRFTKETELELEVGDRRSIYYRHGAHPVIKDRKLGKATLKEVDEAGAFFEGELNLRDDYEKYIYKLAELGKLGWSTGSMPHLVRKELNGKKAMEIKSWPIGEISLTPNPVEARTSAFPVKALADGEMDELDTFIKSQEELPFDLAGTPALSQFCDAVAPHSTKDGSHRSESAANAAKEFVAITRILGEAYDSYTSRLVKRTENRFLKEGREIDPSTVVQVENTLQEMGQVQTAFDAVKDSLTGIKKISDMSRAEQRAMNERARIQMWNFCQISGLMPEELEDVGTNSSNGNMAQP